MTSFSFTFLNLIEFCLILAISQYRARKVMDHQPEQFLRNNTGDAKKKRTTVEAIKLCSKVAIPAGYALFVSIFLGIYLGGEEQQSVDGRELVPLESVEMKL